MIRRVFVSDVHMGLGGQPYDWLNETEAEAFGEFLDYVAGNAEFHELILVGDTMDDWVYPINKQPPTYADIEGKGTPTRHANLDKLRAIAKSKPVTYIVGNHDITITQNSIPNFGNGTSSNVIFQWSYDVDGLWAEHGNRYTIWNAWDQKNDVPVGHYISRLSATAGRPARWQDAIDDILHSLDPTRENPYVNLPIDYFVNTLGITEETDILTTAGAAITVADVREQYADLSERWKNGNHDYPGLMEQFLMERSPLGLDQIAPLTAMRGHKKVVIFGHTHMEKIEYVYTWDPGPKGPENIYEAVYANCGAWCQERPYSYVLDEYDGGRHTVSLMRWPDKAPVRPPLTI
jgi:UDP-2,3-diacylglucosamine pyrophosphatase LpxH